VIIGIDDTDSKKGMCTTYLCAVLIKELKKYGEISVPRLVRLNPCIPFKTRGNGAVSFEIGTKKEKKVKQVVIEKVCQMSELDEAGTNPGVVFINDHVLELLQEKGSKNSVNEELNNFYKDAVREVLEIEDAYELISKLGCDYFGLKNERGVIGALAAAAFLIRQKSNNLDFTYELMAYRQKERWGLPRFIDEASVWEADNATYPLTWDTVDVARKKIVFAPHSPCPVLWGIRGDDVEAIHKAYHMIRAEPVERVQLFISNQGTDSHLIPSPSLKEKIKDFRSYILDGVVNRGPYTIEGGHVVFGLGMGKEKDGEMSVDVDIDCIAYEPTKGFRDVIRKLRLGDEIIVYGSLKKGTLNVEKIEILNLKVERKRNPKCDICGKSMKSVGKGQGYKCKRCKTHAGEKAREIEERGVEIGLYEVPPVARRHISKPLVRMSHLHENGAKKIHPSR
jgi:tRNA(Ile2)-agmatinylcytidine synthase